MWSQVTLKQFHALSHIENSDDIPLQKAVDRLKVLGIEPDMSSFGNLLSQIPEFLQHLPSDEMKDNYLIKGELYHPFVNFSTMSPARFLDIYHQIQGKDPQDVSEWTYMLSLCLSKHGEPYDYQTHIDRAPMLYDTMTFDQAYPMVVFFSKVWTALQGIILDSSTEKLRIQLKELIETYKENTENSPIIGAGSLISAK